MGQKCLEVMALGGGLNRGSWDAGAGHRTPGLSGSHTRLSLRDASTGKRFIRACLRLASTHP